MREREDEFAVDRVLAGDIAAFEQLVRRWQRPLVNLAYRFFRDRGRAEDMAQEAFVRAYRGLKSWRRDSAFSTWLFALATNLYRSELRRLGGQALVSLDELHDAIETRAAAPLSDHMETLSRERAVRRAVLTLPPKYREALILFYFHELDVAAAAASLGVPDGTLKARLSRARTMLRDKLQRVVALPPRETT